MEVCFHVRFVLIVWHQWASLPRPARIRAGCLICCSISSCAGHTRALTWRSTLLFFASPPSTESALAAVLFPLPRRVLLRCLCTFVCRSPPVPRHRRTLTSTQPGAGRRGARARMRLERRRLNGVCVQVLSHFECIQPLTKGCTHTHRNASSGNYPCEQAAEDVGDKRKHFPCVADEALRFHT